MTPRPTGLKQLLMLWEELQVGTNADATQNVDSSKNDHPILAPLKANFDDTVLLLLDLSLSGKCTVIRYYRVCCMTHGIFT